MSARKVRALVVLPSGRCHLVHLEQRSEWLNELVGGWIEAVSTTDTDWHAYVNEEGKLMGMERNVLATLIARSLGWTAGGDVLVGTAVFLGDGPGGTEADVPERVLAAWRSLTTEVARAEAEDPWEPLRDKRSNGGGRWDA